MAETKEDVIAKYEEMHSVLSSEYCQAHVISKAEFDIAHSVVWADMDAELIEKGFKTAPEPKRDFGVEISALEVRIAKLELVKL